jgi:single-stranded-DNA-specific exonuclease
MSIPSVTSAQIASALQRCYDFPAAQAQALATAGPAHIRSPWAIPGMEALVERLVRALRSREQLLLFGDFDADGVTGTAVLFATLSAYSDRVERYTPFYREGYGLHVPQIEAFHQRGIRVVVTVDSGVSSYEAVERAHDLGLTVLVTDHHLPHPDRGPAGTLAINPPDFLLAGAQLAYLTAQAVRERVDGQADHDPWGLALSAVGAQGDWVRVDRPETRAWIAQGLAAIQSAACPRGLRALQEVLGEHTITSEMRPLWGLLNMGKRSPRVDPSDVVEALLPDTPAVRSREILEGLVRERTRTYAASEAFTAQALEGVRAQAEGSGLFIHEVPPGDDSLSEVEGPLASRVAAMLRRPVLILRSAGYQVNFSGRARGGFSFESFLSDPEICALTLAMGGHRQAIGGSIRPQDRTAFVAAARRWEQRQPPTAALPPPQHPPIVLEQIDPATAYLYGRAIGPFGHQMRPPRFRTNLVVRGGWAFSGDSLVELARPLGPGAWEVGFRFDEAGCDGEKVAIRVGGMPR